LSLPAGETADSIDGATLFLSIFLSRSRLNERRFYRVLLNEKRKKEKGKREEERQERRAILARENSRVVKLIESRR